MQISKTSSRAAIGNLQSPDVLLAIGILSMLSMMIVPLPTVFIDSFLALNIAGCTLILLVSLFTPTVLSFSSFPSLLLLTTLFRLALNISTTRTILGTGKGGAIVESFGRFVIGGDLIVGLVIFGVVTIVQFMVIAKGAERVAEVGARFSLDAMPGKQMSIDAALRSGAVDDEEAQSQRDDLERESKLFGSMDGAMKFVKGDAIAGLLITALNLVAGVLIGVVRHGLTVADAVSIYSILSVGDGLVAQIPALLITVAAGIITTRVQSKDKETSLASSLKTELLHNPRAIAVTGFLCFVLAMVPGMPPLPFLMLAVGLGVAATTVAHRHHTMRMAQQQSAKAQLKRRIDQAKLQRAAADQVAPAVTPVSLELDPELSAALGFTSGGDDVDAALITELVPQLRDALYLETGLRFPGVQVRSHSRRLGPGTFAIRIKEVPVLERTLRVDALVALAPAEQIERTGSPTVEALNHPVSGTEICYVAAEEKDNIEAAGIPVWNLDGLLALFLAGGLKKHAREFIGLQEVADMVERLEKAYPALVREVVPKLVSLQQVVEILRRLVDEGISIRDLKTIVEALAESAAVESDTVALTERARAALSLQIAHSFAGVGGQLPVLLLGPEIEDAVRDAVVRTPTGTHLALDPEIRREILGALQKSVRPALEQGVRLVVLTSSDIRRYFRKLIEMSMPSIAVLSIDELPYDLHVQPLGRATLDDDDELSELVSAPGPQPIQMAS